MSMDRASAQAMTQKLQTTIPLCAFMQLEIVSLTDRQATARAPLRPNRNLHGTAFAGSQYALAVAVGWGFVQHQLDAAGIRGELVIRDGHIRYRRPVRGELQLTAQSDRRESVRAGEFPVRVELSSEGKTCAEFTGSYVVVQDKS
jgi:thioesterase domain-containing protein